MKSEDFNSFATSALALCRAHPNRVRYVTKYKTNKDGISNLILYVKKKKHCSFLVYDLVLTIHCFLITSISLYFFITCWFNQTIPFHHSYYGFFLFRKVTDDNTCLIFQTNSAEDVEKVERLNKAFLQLMNAPATEL